MSRRVVVLLAVLAAVVASACEGSAPGRAVTGPVPGVGLDVPAGFALPSDRSPSSVGVASAQWAGIRDPRLGVRAGISVHVFCEDVPLRDRAADRGMLSKPLPLEIVAIGEPEPVDVRGADDAIRFDVERSGEILTGHERLAVRSQELLAASAGRTIHVIVASPLGDLAPEVVLPEGLGRSVLSSVRLDPAGLPSCSDAGPVE